MPLFPALNFGNCCESIVEKLHISNWLQEVSRNFAGERRHEPMENGETRSTWLVSKQVCLSYVLASE